MNWVTTSTSPLNTSSTILYSTFYSFCRTYFRIWLLSMILNLERLSISLLNCSHMNFRRCIFFQSCTFLFWFFLSNLWKFLRRKPFLLWTFLFLSTFFSDLYGTKTIKVRIQWFMSICDIGKSLDWTWNLSYRLSLYCNIIFLNFIFLFFNFLFSFQLPHFINDILIFLSKFSSIAIVFSTIRQTFLNSLIINFTNFKCFILLKKAEYLLI